MWEGALSRRLTEAETPREFVEIAGAAEAAQKWARTASRSLRLQHKYGVLRLDSLRGLGNAIDKMALLRGRPKSGPGRNAFPTLQQVLGTKTRGEARKLAHLARQLAAISETIYRKYLAEAEEAGEPVSPNGLREFAAPIRRSQCFTDRTLAKRLYELTLDKLAEHGISVDAWIEPSAGDGVFYDLLPPHRRLGIDIDPRREEFIAGDFLKFDGFKPGVKYATIGNPPWPNNGCVKFFNHAAKFCTVIAFMLPRSFERDCLPNRLDPRFTLLHRESLPVTLFRHGHKGQVFASIFQIWIRDDVQHRAPEGPVRSHRDFHFLPRDTDWREADIILRRVGTDAGRILVPGETPVPENSLLIRVSPAADVAAVRARLTSVSWDSPKYLNIAAGHAERGYKAISMTAVVAEYDRVAELDLCKSLIRSLVGQGHGEELRHYIDAVMGA